MPFQKGHKINNGRKHSKEIVAKTDRKGKNNNNWKGKFAKKNAIHLWVVRRLGFANLHKCVDCGKQAENWSNKDHTYKRILDDYKPRCRKCHSIFDEIWLKRERNSKGQFMGLNKQKPLF